jgi:hypothetical protein
MENNDNIIMSRIAFERMQSKDERNDRWRNIIIILLIILLVATNGMWLWAWNQYDYVETEEYSVDLDADDGGNANYVGNDGDIYNGESDSNQTKNTEKGA